MRVGDPGVRDAAVMASVEDAAMVHYRRLLAQLDRQFAEFAESEDTDAAVESIRKSIRALSSKDVFDDWTGVSRTEDRAAAESSLRHAAEVLWGACLDAALGVEPFADFQYTSPADLETCLLAFPRVDLLVDILGAPDHRRVFAANERAFRSVCRLMGTTLNRAVEFSARLALSEEEEARFAELGEAVRTTQTRSPELAALMERRRTRYELLLGIDRLRATLAAMFFNRFHASPDIEVEISEIFVKEVDGLPELVQRLLRPGE